MGRLFRDVEDDAILPRLRYPVPRGNKEWCGNKTRIRTSC